MTEATNDLLPRVQHKRAELERYIAAAAPRRRRLLNLTMFAGTAAAALTAAPALGGQAFTAWLTKSLGLGSPSWQLLCGAAAVCSLTATVATQLLKSHNIEEHVTRAQGIRAKLEMIEVGLASGHLDPSQATYEYLRCIEDSAFLQGI
jgi:hypothetical protein